MLPGYKGHGFSISQAISEITVSDNSEMKATSAHTAGKDKFIGIIFFIEGKSEFFIEGDYYSLEPQDTVFFNATEIRGIVHRESCQYNRICIRVYPEFFIINNLTSLEETLNNKYPGEGNHISHSTALGEMLNTQFETLKTLLYTPRVSPDLISGTIEEIIKLLGVQVSRPGGEVSNPLLRKILLYISENFHYEIGLNSIAEEFHINRTHLARIFKQLTNCSVSQYITAMRLERVKQFQRYSHLSLKDAVEAVGFKNYSTFYRAHKKHYGIAPRKNDPLTYDIYIDFDANH